MTSRVKISEFIVASRRYLETNLAAVNSLGSSRTISRGEAGRLPQDLQDNWARLKVGNRAVDRRLLIDTFMKDITTGTRAADRNHDGSLTATEGRALPAHVRDNFVDFLQAKQPRPQGVRDSTPAARVRAHGAAYGPSRVSYPEAFNKAAAQVLVDEASPESPRALLREQAEADGRHLTTAQLDAKLKRLFEGLELLPVGEAEESGADPRTHWIFSVRCDVGTDHGFWVAVDRTSGEAFVDGFN